jgi:uncharacterized membrane protein YdjX (TVP38/TMEM64 family)
VALEQGSGKNNLKLMIFIGLVVFVVLASYFFKQYLTLENLQAYKDQMRGWVEGHYFLSAITFIFSYFLVVAFSIPGAVLFSLSAGFFFGPVFGLIYANLGATAGAVAVFLVARYLLRDMVQAKVGDKIAAFDEGFSRDGLWYMFTLRLVPLFPFWMVNLVPALTSLPLRTYFIGTMVGIIPGGFAYVYMGTTLGTINSLSDIISVQVLVAFGLLGGLSLIPVVLKKIRPTAATETA